MKEVYFLLRENRQTGPYSIDELLQQHLKDGDLVWVDGKSLAWSLPSEIEGLTLSSKGFYEKIRDFKPVQTCSFKGNRLVPGKTSNRKNAGKPRTMTERKNEHQPRKYADEIEKKADELRKRALSFESSYAQHSQGFSSFSSQPQQNNRYFFRSEDDPVDIVYHRRPQGRGVAQVVTFVIIAAFVSIGWFGGLPLLESRMAAVTVQTKPNNLRSTSEHAAASVPTKPSAPVAATDTVRAENSGDTLTKQVNQLPASVFSMSSQSATPQADTQRQTPVVNFRPERIENNREETSLPVPAQILKEEPKTDSPVAKPREQIKPKEDSSKPDEENKPKKAEAITDSTEKEEQEKKKGFLKGLFKKKNKDQEN